MKKRVAPAAIVAVFVLSAPNAFADRRTSLQGNRLIEDRDDTFTYPHLTGIYTDQLTLDVAGPGLGNALFTMNAGVLDWGVALHRGDLFDAASITGLNEQRASAPLSWPMISPPSEPGEPGEDGGGALPMTAADMLLSVGNFGFRFGYGAVVDRQQSAGEGPSTAGSQFGHLGVSARLGSFDSALHTTFTTSEETASGEPQNDTIQVSTAVVTRGALAISDTLDLGILGRASFAFERNEVIPEPSVSQALAFDVVAGAGPRVELGENATIAGYATLGFENTNVDPDTSQNNDTISASSLLLPGANVAMEVGLARWVHVRAGAEYNHALLLGSTLSDMGEDTTRTNTTGFDYHVGVGLNHRGFRLDGTFSPGYLLQGPDLLGGEAPLFALVSLGYDFGVTTTLDAVDTPEDSKD